MEGTKEATYDIYLQKRLEDYLAEGGISQAELGKRMGISGAVLSSYRKGTYRGSVENVEARLQAYFDDLDKQAEHKQKLAATGTYRSRTDYVPISTSEDIKASIQYCQLEKGIVILHGDAGVGKTKAAQQFVRENPTTAIYMQVTPTTGSLGVFIRELAEKLKISRRRSKLETVIAIRERVEGTNLVLIIDEAQHLQYRALEEIRTLSDPNPITEEDGIGIVLIGNSKIYNRMYGRQEAEFAQLFSRVNMNRSYHTRDLLPEDLKKLFPEMSHSAKELDFLYGVATSRWGLRGAVNVYNNALNHKDITYQGLLLMARNMGVGALSA